MSAYDRWANGGEHRNMHVSFQILAEGIPWEDSEGHTSWPEYEVYALAEVVEKQGYDPVEVVPA